jgi:hypothetical protein
VVVVLGDAIVVGGVVLLADSVDVAATVEALADGAVVGDCGG